MISFGYVDSKAKIFLILYPPLENSTTRTTIMYIFAVYLSNVAMYRLYFFMCYILRLFRLHNHTDISVTFLSIPKSKVKRLKFPRIFKLAAPCLALQAELLGSKILNHFWTSYFLRCFVGHSFGLFLDYYLKAFFGLLLSLFLLIWTLLLMFFVCFFGRFLTGRPGARNL